jgi:serine phosphatase RsbU (regulator of sigma subunit)
VTVEDAEDLTTLATQPLLVVAVDGSILAANNVAAELDDGLRPGKLLQDAVDDADEVLAHLQACARDGGVRQVALRLPGHTSDDGWAAEAVRIHLADGPAIALQGTCREDTGIDDRLADLQREVDFRTAAERQGADALQLEQAARDRLARLQRLTGALSRATEVGHVVNVVLSTVLDDLDGDEAWVCLLDDAGTDFDVIGYFGAHESTVEAWRRFPREPGLPVTDALASGDTVSWESLQERDRRYPVLRGYPMAHEAYIVSPMIVENRAIGALMFGFAGRRQLHEQDHSFVRAIADQTAQAVLRAQVHEEEAHAHTLQRFLAEASLLLAGSLDYEQVLMEVATLAVPTLADGCVVHLADGGLWPVAVAHADPEKRRQLAELVEQQPPVRNPYLLQVAETGKSLLLPTLPDEILEKSARDDEHRQMVEQVGITSGLVVALTARGRTLGTLSLISNHESRVLGQRELQVAEDLANRAGLAIDNARLYAERTEVARVLQQALLPPQLPSIPWASLAARHQPATELLVGGDFYDVFENSDGSWTVIIGDVCGKDATAATLTGLARHTARAITARDASPREVLEVMNEAFLQYESTEQFCTAACARLRKSDDGIEVELVLAGHPPPVLVRGDGDVRCLDDGGQPVGLFPDLALRTDHVTLAPGDGLVLYTDGVTEARCGDSLFDDSGLLAALREHGPGPADRLVDHVVAAVTDYQGPSRGDDIAVLALTADHRPPT